MKVALGLSGGVDSAVAAALLKEQGFAVTGVFLECWNEPASRLGGPGCRTDKDRQDALGVAFKLKIPFKVLDFKKEYRQKVLDKFYREYKAGKTPNPDIVCNQVIKFGLFLSWSLKNGFDFLATGHYAQIQKNKLYQSADEKKDQTYFLAMLKPEQLSRVLFPIGHWLKKQVRLEAKKRGLKVWNKKDSSGICFIGHDLNFREFLKRKIRPHRGEAVDKQGKTVGYHDGVEFYTIGQSYARPLFVIEKDMLRNRLIVGKRADLAKKELEVERWSWIREGYELNKVRNLKKVRIRHQGRLIQCKIVGEKVFLKQAEYGIAPGQVAVVYQETEGSDPSEVECLGGGVIK